MPHSPTKSRAVPSRQFPALRGVLSDDDAASDSAGPLDRRVAAGRVVEVNATNGGCTSSSSGGTRTASNASTIDGTQGLGALIAASRASANVPRTFAFNIVDGAAFSLWQQSVFQQLVYDLSGKSNGPVGYIAGVMGAAQVLSAIVGSVYADKRLLRQTVMRLGSLSGLAGAGLTAAGVYFRSLGLFYAGAVGWGCYVGLNNPSVEALFADSVDTMHRTTVYTQKWMACIASYLVGYAATLVLFWRIGNRWDMDDMAIVMYAGLGCHCLAFALLWTIRDRFKLGTPAQQTHHVAADDDDDRDASAAAVPIAEPIEGPTAMRTHCTQCHGVGGCNDDAAVSNGGANISARDGLCKNCWAGGVDRCADDLAIMDGPIVGSLGGVSFFSICTLDLNRSMVSGAAIHSEAIVSAAEGAGGGVATRSILQSRRDVAVGFDGDLDDDRRALLGDQRGDGGDRYGTAPPVAVAATADATAPAIGFPAKLLTTQGIPYWIVFGDFLSAFGAGMTLRYFPLFFIHEYGLSPAALTFLFAGSTIVITAMASIVKLAAVKLFRNRATTAVVCRLIGSLCMFYMAYAQDFFGRLGPMIAVFVLRMSVMNSISGLTRSVIMDHVPPSERARWSAVESLCNFTWAGSAVVGGAIADAHGYRATFVVTGAIHCVAALLVIPAARMLQDGVFKLTPDEAAANAALLAAEADAKARLALRAKGRNASGANSLPRRRRRQKAEAAVVDVPEEVPPQRRASSEGRVTPAAQADTAAGLDPAADDEDLEAPVVGSVNRS